MHRQYLMGWMGIKFRVQWHCFDLTPGLAKGHNGYPCIGLSTPGDWHPAATNNNTKAAASTRLSSSLSS